MKPSRTTRMQAITITEAPEGRYIITSSAPMKTTEPIAITTEGRNLLAMAPKIGPDSSVIP